MELKDLSGVVVLLVVAIIIIAIGGTILQEVKTNNYESVSVVKEAHAVSDSNVEENILLDNYGRYVSSLVVSSIYSNTSALCTASNYTAITPNMSITFGAVTGGLMGCNCSTIACNVTYSFLGMTGASNTSAGGQGAMTSLAKWTPTIAIVAAAAILLGIIINSFRT